MRDVYAPIKCAQIQKARKQEWTNNLCFVALLAIGTFAYIIA